jgi:hypothetical protein
LGNTYEPVSFDTVVRVSPVSCCVTVIVTPGNTPPLWSRTVPLIVAVACAHADPHAISMATTAVPQTLPSRRAFIEEPPGL